MSKIITLVLVYFLATYQGGCEDNPRIGDVVSLNTRCAKVISIDYVHGAVGQPFPIHRFCLLYKPLQPGDDHHSQLSFVSAISANCSSPDLICGPDTF